jgi:hypothetical protein
MRIPAALRRRKHTRTIHWITDDLAVAAGPAPDQWTDVVSAGFGAVVDLRTPQEGGTYPSTPLELAYRALPVEDGYSPRLEELLDVSTWILTNLRAGRTTLINCREGRGRSALVACATLMQLGYSLESAYQVVRRGQPRVALSDDQVRVLEWLSSFVRSSSTWNSADTSTSFAVDGGS